MLYKIRKNSLGEQPMKLLCKLFGHKLTFEDKKLLLLPYGKHHCERCGLLYKYNESEPDTYVKWLDKHMD